MSEVENALAGAEVAPVANADAPQAEQAPAPEPTTEQVEAQEQDKPRDEKGRFVPQERVNEITKARREAERRADAHERRADALERELASYRQPQPVQHQPQSNEAPPSIEQFSDIGEWSRAMTDFAVRQAEARIEDRLRGQDQQRSMQQLADQFDERSRQYAATNPGFEDRLSELSRSVQFNPYVVEAIGVSEHGPAVADYLAQHLDEADAISRMNPHIAALHLGRIEAKVSAPKPKPVTNAPSPAPVLGGGGKPVPALREDMSYAEYKAARERGEG